jgi:outer membrane immunogenic protein
MRPICQAGRARRWRRRLPYNWTGPYIGLGGGYDRTRDSPTAGIAGSKNTQSHGAFGGYAGYNFQFGPIVYGLEANAALLTSGSKSNGVAGTTKFRERYDGSVRARAGYAIDRWLVYGTGGFAFRDHQIATPSLMSKSNTQTGWIAGAGIERALTNNLVARLEYTHADYGNSIEYSGRAVRAGCAGRRRHRPRRSLPRSSPAGRRDLRA